MTLQELIQELKPLTKPNDYSQVIPTTAYASDLLSCVMAGAPKRSVWITLQAHGNIVAVATLLDLSAIIITEGAQPESATIDKANEENVILLSTRLNTYQLAGRLWELGLHD